MKVAIIETNHFQYALTQSEIFDVHEKIFFTRKKVYEEMHSYAPELCKGKFIVFDNLEKDADLIIQKCNEEKIDLLLVSPIFDYFLALEKIALGVKSKKVLTIHNLNTWLYAKFWSIRSLQERNLKRRIVKLFDYIAVEDFIYQYLANENKSLFKKHSFIYIPFTIYYPRISSFSEQKDSTLKVVLPGSIHRERRRYEDTIAVIEKLADENAKITFSFAGPPLEEYGKNVIRHLDEVNKKRPGFVTYFSYEDSLNPKMFLKEMESSDLVLSTSTHIFKALGTTEYIGKTKPTAAIHDMMSFQLPGLLPAHLPVPENLKGSVFNYKNQEELYLFLKNLIQHPEELISLKEAAKVNSLHFTAQKIREKLPFFK